MKRVIRLTESDLARIVKRVIMEGGQSSQMTLTYQTCPKVGFKVIINESSKIEEIYLHGTDDEFAECKINIESLKKRIKDIKGGTIEQVGNKSEYYVYDKSGYQVGKDPFKSI